jgi:hypothetical protein
MFIDIHCHAFKRPYIWIDGKPLFSTPKTDFKFSVMVLLSGLKYLF